MPALSTLVRFTAAAVVRLIKAVLLLVLLAGIPYGLLTQIGSPLPRHLPTTGQIRHELTGPVSDTLVLGVLALALWILWAAFTVSFVVEVVAAVRGVPRLRLGPIAPLQTLAGWLVAGITAGVLAAAPAMAVAGHATPAAAVVVHPPDRTTPASYAAVTTAHRPPPAFTLTVSTVEQRDPITTAATTNASAPAIQMPVYEVRHGDWLGVIAQRYLGDFDRYHDIQRLNPDLIEDPNHIEPTWRLILPADAHDHGTRLHATGHLVVKPPASANPGHGNPAQRGPGGAQPSPGGGGGAASSAPSATASPTATPSPSASAASSPSTDPTGIASPSTAAAGPAASAHAGNSSRAPHHDPPAYQQPGRGHGVNLPGGWISLPLGVALVAAAAMVWLRRRHRYVPTPLGSHTTEAEDADLRPLPPVVNRVHRAIREQAPDLLQPTATLTPTVADYHATDAGHRPDLPPVGPSGLDLAGLGDRVPAGGLGLVGPGAEAAARALLVATLSTGSPADPDAKGHVITPADALTTLLGADAVHVGDIPRLHVTGALSEALTRAEELLIERRRMLEDHDSTDLAEMRVADPYHPPMPPVLLLADTPPPELRARLTTALHLGGPLQISAILLGEWPRGDTVTVRADGHTGDTRLGVLDVPTTLQLLEVLREAHTGQPATAPAETPPRADLATPAPTVDPAGNAPGEPASHDSLPSDAQPSPAPSAVPTPPEAMPAAPTSDEVEPATSADPATSVEAAGGRLARRHPVRVHLLGEPTILDRDGSPVTGLRHHARELLVYLAVHRSGADLSQIMEAFWPSATVRRAGERLSTEVANLRGRIKYAAGVTNDDKGFQPVVNTGSRYHLNPELLDIDVWHLVDLLRRAGATTDPTGRAVLLRQAVDASTGTLAEGYDYDWITQPREQLRRNGIRARLDLATLLADTEPATAADLLRAATLLDPINEDLARRAMRALARVGDAAAVRAVLQQLRTALDDINEEPSAETIALAAQMRRDVSSTSAASDDQTRKRGRP